MRYTLETKCVGFYDDVHPFEFILEPEYKQEDCAEILDLLSNE